MVLRVVGDSWVCIKKGSGRRGNSTIRYSEVDRRQSRKRRVHSRQQKNVCVSIHAGEHDSSGSKFGTRLRGIRLSLYGQGPLGEVKATKSQGQKHGMKGILTFRALASEQGGSNDVIAARDRRLFKPRLILGSSLFGSESCGGNPPILPAICPCVSVSRIHLMCRSTTWINLVYSRHMNARNNILRSQPLLRPFQERNQSYDGTDAKQNDSYALGSHRDP